MTDGRDIEVAPGEALLQDSRRLIYRADAAAGRGWAPRAWAAAAAAGLATYLAVVTASETARYLAQSQAAAFAVLVAATAWAAAYVLTSRVGSSGVVVLDRRSGRLVRDQTAVCDLSEIKHVEVAPFRTGAEARQIVFCGPLVAERHQQLCIARYGGSPAQGVALAQEFAAYLGVECLVVGPRADSVEHEPAVGPMRPLFDGLGQCGSSEALARALLRGDAEARLLAATVLGALPDAEAVARELICCAALTGRERTDALRELTREDAFVHRAALWAVFSDLPTFCAAMLESATDDSERLGAQAVIAALSGEVLLRPSDAPPEEAGRLLLRPASGPPQTPAEQLLRPADAPEKR